MSLTTTTSSSREGKCAFLVPRKNRLCTGSSSSAGGAGGDGTFCAIHRPDAARRVQCPVDPRHDVKEVDLASHVVKCRAVQAHRAQSTVSPYFRVDASVPPVTLAACSVDGTAAPAPRLRDMNPDDGVAFLAWIEAQHNLLHHQPWWKGVSVSEPAARGLVELDAYVAVGDHKHRHQQSILAALLLHRAAAGTRLSSVLEVGAGKGGVGCALKLARPDLRVTLVERATFSVHKEKEVNKQLRHQGNAAAHEGGGVDGSSSASLVPMKRVSLDAKDFHSAAWWRDEVATITSSSPPQLDVCCGVVGKHLCGGCSDFALRMAMVIAAANDDSARPEDVDLEAKKRPRTPPPPTPSPRHTSCVVLATCCHHLCSYQWYLGAHVTLNGTDDCGNGVVLPSSASVLLFPSAKHFDLLRSICSWAIIGGEGNIEDDHHDNADDETATTRVDTTTTSGEGVPCGHWLSAIARPRKVALGRMAKTLIDAGRVRTLQQSGLFQSVQYVQYVDPSISGECWAIIATSK